MVLGIPEWWEDVHWYTVSSSSFPHHSATVGGSYILPKACGRNNIQLIFSSLAMAEMTTLTASIYRSYQTVPAPGYENITPGITSRFEVFYDVQVPEMKVCTRANVLKVQHVNLY